MTHILRIDEMINEGAGAGYFIEISNIKLDTESVTVSEKPTIENGNQLYNFTINILTCQCKWKVEGAYEATNSDVYAECCKPCTKIKGGTIKGRIDPQDIVYYHMNRGRDIDIEDIDHTDCEIHIVDSLDSYKDGITIASTIGAGWFHHNLTSKFTIEDKYGIEGGEQPLANNRGICFTSAHIESNEVGKSIDDFFENPNICDL